MRGSTPVSDHRHVTFVFQRYECCVSRIRQDQLISRLVQPAPHVAAGSKLDRIVPSDNMGAVRVGALSSALPVPGSQIEITPRLISVTSDNCVKGTWVS